MKRLLRINDLHDDFFLSMPEILSALPPEAASLQWRILDIGEVVLTEDSELNVPDLEERVFALPVGLPLSFAELSDFADNTRQVIDGLFIATADGSKLPERSDDDATILDRSEVVVAAVDSSFWLVGASDPVLGRLKTTFHNVVEEDPPSTPLSTWGRSTS